MERFCMRSVKKVQLEKRYVLICRCLIPESVAVPHPPLRGTFPPGEAIALRACAPNINLLIYADKHIIFFGVESDLCYLQKRVIFFELSIVNYFSFIRASRSLCRSSWP